MYLAARRKLKVSVLSATVTSKNAGFAIFLAATVQVRTKRTVRVKRNARFTRMFFFRTRRQNQQDEFFSCASCFCYASP